MAKQPHSEARCIQGVHPTPKRERKPGCKLHLPLAACSICKSSPTLWFSAPAHPFPTTSTCGDRVQCTSHRGRHKEEGDKMMRGTLDSAESSVRQTRQARAEWHDAWECDGTRVPANPCAPVLLPLRQGPDTAASCARQQRSEHHVSALHVCSFRHKQAAFGRTPARRALRKGRATQQLIAPGCARKPPHARAARGRQPGCRDPCQVHGRLSATNQRPAFRNVGVQRGGGRQARSHAGVAKKRLPAGHHRHFERGAQLDAYVSEEGALAPV